MRPDAKALMIEAARNRDKDVKLTNAKMKSAARSLEQLGFGFVNKSQTRVKISKVGAYIVDKDFK